MIDITQDYDIYLDGGACKACGQIDGAELASGPASAVIQVAIDKLGEGGGAVCLQRGTYTLDRPVRLRDHVTLKGKGRGTKLVAADTFTGEALIIAEEVLSVEVRDLLFTANQEPSCGVVYDATGDSRITNVTAAGFAFYGFWIRKNSFLCSVESCVAAGCGRAGIFCDRLGEGRYGDYVPTRIANCTVYGGGNGIACSHAIVVNIVGCVVYQTNGYGFYLRDTSNSIVISGCRTFQISNHAVVVEDTHELNITGNIFCWHTGHGVVIHGCSWGTITGNNVIDNGSYNFDCRNFTRTPAELPEDLEQFNGIDISASRGCTVQGNAIFNWACAPRMLYGIREDGECFKNVIANNTVNLFEHAAVLSEGKESIARDNAGHEYPAFEGNDKNIQTYHRQLTEDFIRLVRRDRE
jgi:parallel beta-helix repeat protein